MNQGICEASRFRSGDEFAPPGLRRDRLGGGLGGGPAQGRRGVGGGGNGFARGKACDEQASADARGQDYEGRLGMMESGIDRIGMANLRGATTKATDYRFRGVIVECDPANHETLRTRPTEERPRDDSNSREWAEKSLAGDFLEKTAGEDARCSIGVGKRFRTEKSKVLNRRGREAGAQDAKPFTTGHEGSDGVSLGRRAISDKGAPPREEVADGLLFRARGPGRAARG